MVGISF